MAENLVYQNTNLLHQNTNLLYQNTNLPNLNVIEFFTAAARRLNLA